MVENKENFEKGLNFEKVKYKLYKIQLNEKEKIQNLIFDNIQPSIYYFLKYLVPFEYEDIGNNNNSEEQTLDLSNNAIVYDSENNETNASINTNNFSFLKENNNEIEITEFDIKILKNYVAKEIDNLQTEIRNNKSKYFKRSHLELKLELNLLENNIECYFNKPIMKRNLKEKNNEIIRRKDTINTNKNNKEDKKFFDEEDEDYDTDN